MNRNVSDFLIFAAGATIGSVVTWQLLKKKYEQIAQEEIDSVKEVFSRNQEKKQPAEEEPVLEPYPDEFDDEDIQEQIDIIESEGYAPQGENKPAKPYVISPDEFGEIDDYEQVSLTYFIDGTLADDNEKIIDDVDDVIGMESLNHFGEYEDDSVFVRNDKHRCDYEILLDQRNYSDVLRDKPYLAEE